MTATALRSAAPTTVRDDLVTVGLTIWVIVGLFVDAYAHVNILDDDSESFFTPWHGIFYSGFLVVAGWILYLVMQRMQPGEPWYRAIPRGYHTAVAGLAVFAAGGVGDGIWHTLFGVEVSLDALLSPTHLLLLSGMLLITVSPYLASNARPGSLTPGPREFLPPLLSLLCATSVIAFFFEYIWAPGMPSWFRELYVPETDRGLATASLAIAAAMVSTIILVTPVVIALRRWRPPPGTFTVLWGVVNVLLVTSFDLDAVAIWAGLAGGIAADVLTDRLEAGPDRPWAAHAVAFVAPVALWAAFLLLTHRAEPLGWPAEVWSGTVFFAGLAGLGLSLLARPGTAPPLASAA